MSVFSDVTILHGTPDLLLVTIICVALLRGSDRRRAGAASGAAAASTPRTLGTLGVTSLLLTVAGYWIGRYGETTGRDRAHAPFVSVAVITVLYALGSLAFHFVLGDPAPAREVLWSTLFQAIALNLLLTWPVYALARLAAAAAGRARDRVERCTLAWLAPTGSRAGRFLPPDPRVEEPYLLHARRWRCGSRSSARRARRLRRALPPALGAAGALGLRSTERAAQNNQLRTVPIEAPRGPILDRNGPHARHNVAGDRGRALAGRPAEAGPLRAR